MIGWIAALLLFGQVAGPSIELSDEARAFIAPVLDVLAEEQRRQTEAPSPQTDEERLLRMYRLDQLGRKAMQEVDLSGLPADQAQAAETAMWQVQMAIDQANLEALLTMVPPEGWFLKSRYGDRASQAAFLIVQHADIKQWRRFVPILETLVGSGEVDGSQYGLMYDRLAVNEGRPQRYGTQMICKAGRWAVDYENLEAPESADERRAEAGFRQTLAEYEGNFAGYPPCQEAN